MGSDKAFAVILAVFATVVYASALFAGFGMISLLADREPIQSPQAGVLVGPAMFIVASLVTFGFLAWLGVTAPPQNPPDTRRKVSFWRALAAGAAAFVAFGATGGILLAGGSGAIALVDRSVGFLVSPFGWLVGVLSVVVAVLYQLVIAGRYRDRAQPQWPWERNE